MSERKGCESLDGDEGKTEYDAGIERDFEIHKANTQVQQIVRKANLRLVCIANRLDGEGKEILLHFYRDLMIP